MNPEKKINTKRSSFPYDLPPPSAFYSKLNEEGVTDDDYFHADCVWNVFECSTLRDYLELYNKTDVLLLTDVFENFKRRLYEKLSFRSCPLFHSAWLGLGCGSEDKENKA